jgi:diguanylate cyclase
MTYFLVALEVRTETVEAYGVVGFVLAMAILNLGLGYLTALALSQTPFWSGWRLRLPTRRATPSTEKKASEKQPPSALDGAKPVQAEAASVSEIPQPVVALPLVAGMDDLPLDWLSQLAVEGIVAQSFVEAVAHTVRLEIGHYREQLVAAECRTRALTEDHDVAGLARVANDLRTLNQDWLDKQTAAADMLTQRAGRLGDHEQAATALEQALLDQAAQIRGACSTLESFDAQPEPQQRSKQLIEQITSLLVHAHALRDRILDLLAALIRAGNALDSYGPAVCRDGPTQLPNRIGLETMLAAWRREDADRTRLLSAILIDVDRFGRVNQRLGTRSGDEAIIALARLIGESLATDRGFERLIRLGGSAFLILQGDVGPHLALTAAERLRQAIEATTLDDEGTEFDLTISCGVIEVKPSESSLDLVRRAVETMQFAKKAGRNRCALDKGDGPTMLDPPQFPVKGRVVSLCGTALESHGGTPIETPPMKDEG